MPWAILKKILFFCCQEPEEIQDAFDESSHLIPSESVQSPVIYSNVVLHDHKQLYERLGLIVRTKEGKMVNVASQIPFNLHNRVLTPQRSYESLSRSSSASESVDQHSRDHDNYGYSNYGIVIPRQRNIYPSAYSYRPADRTRSPLDPPLSTPILNVRLVGCSDSMTKTRGRTRERQSRSTDMPNITQGTMGSEGVLAAENAETSCEGPTTGSNFKLRDVGSITLNWND